MRFSILIGIMEAFLSKFIIANTTFTSSQNLTSRHPNSIQHFSIFQFSFHFRLSKCVFHFIRIPVLTVIPFMCLFPSLNSFDYIVDPLIMLLHIPTNPCPLSSPTCMGQEEDFMVFAWDTHVKIHLKTHNHNN